MITTLELTDVLFEHALIMYAMLPKKTKAAIKPKLKQFYSLLPQNGYVQRKEANEIGQSLGLSERTVGYYISELKESGLIVGANGKFEKVPET
jgi:DNA-binding transcriptional ArsR family regulator